MKLCILLLVLVQSSLAVDKEQLLIEKLFDDYESKVRPKPSSGENVNIALGMELYQVIEVNEKTESLTSSVWIHMEWTDERLAWNISEYDGVKKINVKPGKMGIK